ncbi:hypothetical protein [Xanthobacter sediminis]|uniref:hypothetical protein n=1 Tax=Xanthobacter sediminis TaxID=3119926 RepID=UPI003729B110
MVTSVDASMSLMSARQAAPDITTAAADAASDALQTLGDQIAARASAAWMRGTSLATNAWIASTSEPSGAEKSSGIPEVGESKSSAGLDSASSSGPTRSRKLAVASEDMLISAMITYNQSLRALPSLQQQLEGYQSQLSSVGDDQMVAYLSRVIAAVTNEIKNAHSVIANTPGAVADGLSELQRTRNVTGTVYTRNSDGSFSFGQFTIVVTLPNGSTGAVWSHDGSGVAIKTVYAEDGTSTQRIELS